VLRLKLLVCRPVKLPVDGFFHRQDAQPTMASRATPWTATINQRNPLNTILVAFSTNQRAKAWMKRAILVKVSHANLGL
jgi:hypothetical protein